MVLVWVQTFSTVFMAFIFFPVGTFIGRKIVSASEEENKEGGGGGVIEENS